MNPSTIYSFDGTLDGFYSLVFRTFQDKRAPANILNRQKQLQMSLEEIVNVETISEHARRVRDSLIKRTGKKNTRLLHVAFLNETKKSDMLLWRYLHKIFKDDTGTQHRNLLDPDVYDLVQCARKVRKEVHRFHGFIRFQLSADGMYFAPIDPDNDIVKLLAPHFKSRYAGQEWVIYDVRRKYGIWFDKQRIHEVKLNKPAFDITSGYIRQQARDMDEDYYCTLWQHYYDAINIIERKNHRQMTAFMPKRYWKYLPEKNRG